MNGPDLDGINVVGMTQERAWEIALTAEERNPTNPVEARVHHVARLLNDGTPPREIRALLNITSHVYDAARKLAIRRGLI